MSHEIVKLIQIKDNAVWMRSESNNVTPKYYHKREQPYLTELLHNDGLDALELTILRHYEEGNFQAGSVNRFTRALERLHAMPEYLKYDWRSNRFPYGSAEYKAFNESRHSLVFDALLKKALSL